MQEDENRTHACKLTSGRFRFARNDALVRSTPQTRECILSQLGVHPPVAEGAATLQVQITNKSRQLLALRPGWRHLPSTGECWLEMKGPIDVEARRLIVAYDARIRISSRMILEPRGVNSHFLWIEILKYEFYEREYAQRSYAGNSAIDCIKRQVDRWMTVFR